MSGIGMETLMMSLKHNHDLIRLDLDDNPVVSEDHTQLPTGNLSEK